MLNFSVYFRESHAELFVRSNCMNVLPPNYHSILWDAHKLQNMFCFLTLLFFFYQRYLSIICVTVEISCRLCFCVSVSILFCMLVWLNSSYSCEWFYTTLSPSPQGYTLIRVNFIRDILAAEESSSLPFEASKQAFPVPTPPPFHILLLFVGFSFFQLYYSESK